VFHRNNPEREMEQLGKCGSPEEKKALFCSLLEKCQAHSNYHDYCIPKFIDLVKSTDSLYKVIFEDIFQDSDFVHIKQIVSLVLTTAAEPQISKFGI